ncbi:MAG: hypothetical protein GC145_17345 [Caulobacter sp.]|nr:hypothetical protein [Caulobacter sp.]
MGRARVMAMLAAAGLMAAPLTAEAMIPPGYGIVVAAPDRETEAVSAALLEAMSSLDAFSWQSADISRSEARACLTEADPVACVRQWLTRRPAEPRARPVIVLARPQGEGRVSWTCVGSGANAAAPAPTPVVIDLRAALFGEPEVRSAERRKAMECLYAAEAQSKSD